MRFVDAMLCFPSIFLLLAISALIEPSVPSIVLLIAMTSWMEVARVVEAQIRSLRTRDFAVAAVSMGSSNARIMFRELLPNASRADRRRGDAERRPRHPGRKLHLLPRLRHPAADAELGQHAGKRPELPDQRALARDPAGAAITLAVTSFNFVGDGLRDARAPDRRIPAPSSRAACASA
jgi:peptide/nickel transport system permease protein